MDNMERLFISLLRTMDQAIGAGDSKDKAGDCEAAKWRREKSQRGLEKAL